MSNRRVKNNKITVILLFSILGVVFLAFVYFMQEKLFNQEQLRYMNVDQLKDDKSKAVSSDTEQQSQEFLSQGNQILITADGGIDKIEAAKAYQNKNYKEAELKFTQSLKDYSNDPEALIYLNNSKASARGNELTIAVSVPIGRNLSVAQEILRGVAQAQNEFNSKQEDQGRLLKVVIANDNNNPELAKKIAIKFVRNPEIMAVVGHNASNASIAAAPIYQEGELVMITPTSSAKSLTEAGDYIYRSTPSTRDLADKIAEYIVNDARKTNLAVCNDKKAKATVSFKSDLTWAVYNYGGIINTVECNFSAPDFNPSTMLDRIISNGADSLLLAPSLRYLNQAIELARANQQQLSLFGSHTMFSFTTLKEGQVSVNGLVLPVAWYPKANDDSTFVTNARELWKGVGSWRTAMAYDATQVILQGLQQTDNRQQLKEIFQSPEFTSQGASEPIHFMQSGDRISRGVLIRVEPGTKSRTGYDFNYLK
ncbi:MAG: ABC transporter substrate-binding protein [Xenococcaceae cyanobacterium MO_167.B52]|nr:ABC transporter substrate-binding protein [Xenococcaceae cyanobacterium MO_167.B52]